MCLHHAVLGNDNAVTTAIARLSDVHRGGDHAYYVDIAHYMAGLSPSGASGARWLDGEQPTRSSWRTLVYRTVRVPAQGALSMRSAAVSSRNGRRSCEVRWRVDATRSGGNQRGDARSRVQQAQVTRP
ncbi:hypothetical protein ACFYRC_34825 [Streptomyces sp. NPDC005279]|uniref:hypothetical protein n=1 Tax=Streptomyces sp. NPDC005279 TaxID=3364712 RepID=UPI0036AD4DDC